MSGHSGGVGGGGPVGRPDTSAEGYHHWCEDEPLILVYAGDPLPTIAASGVVKQSVAVMGCRDQLFMDKKRYIHTRVGGIHPVRF